MRRCTRIVAIVVLVLAVATGASPQEPAASFEVLTGHLHVGQPLWVTDSTGREVRGTLAGISSDGLTLQAGRLETFAASGIRRVRTRDRDSLRNGTLVGLLIGGAMGTAWCVGAIADNSGDIDARVECAEGFTVFPGLGTLVGLTVDAIVPGKLRVLYQPAQARSTARASVTVAPLHAAHARGVAVSVAF